jgi:hypothetical protein
MTTRWTPVLALVLSCALFACSDHKAIDSKDAVADAGVNAPAVSTNQELTPEQLGEIGAKIAKDSAQASQILSQHGLDAKTFEAKIRKITEDPEASRRYAAAYEKAKAG